MDDYEGILSGKWFFARKIDLDVSKGLIEKITEKYADC